MEPWSLSTKRKARFKSVLAPLGKTFKVVLGEYSGLKRQTPVGTFLVQIPQLSLNHANDELRVREAVPSTFG